MPEETLIGIVDDELLYRKILQLVLSKGGYNIAFQAENGVECIYHLQQAPVVPDLIIIDVQMPLMNGYETIKLIKQNWPSVKIIGHSSLLSSGVREKLIECGANDFLVKGRDSWETCEMVQRVLNAV